MYGLNKEKLERLASLIEVQKHVTFENGDNPRDATEGFTMICVTHTCGTPACIAGFGVALAQEDVTDAGRKVIEERRSPYNVVASWLTDTLQPDGETTESYSLTPFTYLFEPEDYEAGKLWSHITPAEAARVIRHFAATNEVDWSIIKEEVAEQVTNEE